MPEESSSRSPHARVRDLAWQQFLRVLPAPNRAQRRRVAKALGVHVRDVRVVDAAWSRCQRARRRLPSTDSKHGGFKLTATLSVLEDVLVSAHITDARRHDRKAFELPADRRGVLWIADRGYTDHTLFAEIADGDGYFLVRLKTSSLPTSPRSAAASPRRTCMSRSRPSCRSGASSMSTLGFRSAATSRACSESSEFPSRGPKTASPATLARDEPA